MKKMLVLSCVCLMMLALTACGNANNNKTQAAPAQENEQVAESAVRKIRVTVGDQVLTATLLDNATAKSFASMLPLTVPMQDLYAREMCYRFAQALPAEEAQRIGYQIGDLSYWIPGRSLVIFYKQNGEVINSLQKIGRFDGSVEIFASSGDVDVTFELLQ